MFLLLDAHLAWLKTELKALDAHLAAALAAAPEEAGRAALPFFLEPGKNHDAGSDQNRAATP